MGLGLGFRGFENVGVQFGSAVQRIKDIPSAQLLAGCPWVAMCPGDLLPEALGMSAESRPKSDYFGS